MAKAKAAATKCPECGKEFKNTQALSGHLRFKHGKRLMTKAGVLSKPVARLEKGGRMVQQMSDAEYFGEGYEDWLKVKDDLNEFLSAEAHCRKVALGWSRQRGIRLTQNKLERMIDLLLKKGVGFPKK